MSAYRSDLDALVAQCDALRSELAEANAGSAELAAKKSELEAKVSELAKARITEAEKGIAARRQSIRGALLGTGFAVLVFGGVAGYIMMSADEAADDSARRASTPANWFAEAKAHCNPVEASVFLANHVPPGGEAGTPYKVACLALAGKFDDARSTLDSLPRSQRADAAGVVFNVVHPVADAGDDVAAGPAMEFVLEYTPNNYMALYHAGMSAYGTNDMPRAKQRLSEFLRLYSVDNHFTQTAIATLAKLEATSDSP
jgi:TolA-binding protein